MTTIKQIPVSQIDYKINSQVRHQVWDHVRDQVRHQIKSHVLNQVVHLKINFMKYFITDLIV
jgi:citrate lyase gamma subunit